MYAHILKTYNTLLNKYILIISLFLFVLKILSWKDIDVIFRKLAGLKIPYIINVILFFSLFTVALILVP
jgi:hypothetical protein